MLIQLNTAQWISLPYKTRQKLVEIFDIPRSKFTEVEGNVIVTDGHTNQDLEAITVEAMQGYLLDTIEEDFFKLFHRVLDAVNTEIDKQDRENLLLIEPEVIEITEVEIINTNQEITNEPIIKETQQEQTGDSTGPKKQGRTRTKAKKS